MKIYAGTSGYAYKEWKGSFYPEKLPQKEMLRYYAGRLGAVEINYTFHHMPTTKLLVGWAGEVPDDFRFAFKAPMRITHFKRLKDAGEETGYFFSTLTVLGEKLGAVLFQFPPNFPTDAERLAAFLPLIPAGVDCAFEFRHPGWNQDQRVKELLAERDHALCVSDMDESPAEGVVGGDSWGYLRLRRSTYSEGDLSAWAERVVVQGWERAFVFFKHEDEADGTDEARRFMEMAASRLPARAD